MLTVQAPAKINLVLEVLGKYDDNHHQIYSILQTINLCDTLNFQLAEEVVFKCSEPGLERSNLVVEAVTALKEVTGCNKGVRIELLKQIPWGMGLGGGSSDAAATLLALNKLWKLKLPIAELTDLAAKLGSDVPFFVYGGTALVEGRGERITLLPSLSPTCFVLLVPPLPKIPDKTKKLYEKLSAEHYSKGQFVRKALPSLIQERRLNPAFMFNVFEKVIFDVFPELRKYKEEFREAGADNIHLAGAGPALFTLVRAGEANELCSRLERQGLECYMTTIFRGELGD